MGQQQDTSRRALLRAVAEQQSIIERQGSMIQALSARVAFIAQVAGISQHVASIRTMADINNPGQPVPDPSEGAPVATTEQAATAEAHDDPTVLGETPGSVQHLQADTVDNPLNLGESLPTSPFGQQVDVTQPVAGTNTGEIPLPSTRTEVDVRVGNPDDPNPAFPWTIATNRTTASLVLARRRIEAGLADGSGQDADILLAASIEKDASLSDAMIEHEAKVLTGVVSTAGRRRQASRTSSVPRAAQGVQRTTPSLAGDGTARPSSLGRTASVADAEVEDLFL